MRGPRSRKTCPAVPMPSAGLSSWGLGRRRNSASCAQRGCGRISPWGASMFNRPVVFTRWPDDFRVVGSRTAVHLHGLRQEGRRRPVRFLLGKTGSQPRRPLLFVLTEHSISAAYPPRSPADNCAFLTRSRSRSNSRNWAMRLAVALVTDAFSRRVWTSFLSSSSRLVDMAVPPLSA